MLTAMHVFAFVFFAIVDIFRETVRTDKLDCIESSNHNLSTSQVITSYDEANGRISRWGWGRSGHSFGVHFSFCSPEDML